MIESARLSKTITKSKIAEIDIGGAAFTSLGVFRGGFSGEKLIILDSA